MAVQDILPISKIKVGILNTSMVGSTVNYTYTAYDDAAGNPGESINRTVTVIDYNLLKRYKLDCEADIVSTNSIWSS